MSFEDQYDSLNEMREVLEEQEIFLAEAFSLFMMRTETIKLLMELEPELPRTLEVKARIMRYKLSLTFGEAKHGRDKVVHIADPTTSLPLCSRTEHLKNRMNTVPLGYHVCSACKREMKKQWEKEWQL